MVKDHSIKKEGNRVKILIYILLSGAVTLPMFFRGVYFEKELLPSLVVIYSIFILWSLLKIKKKDFKPLNTPIDFLILGILIMNLIGVFLGVNKRAALLELSKYMAFLGVFLMAKDLKMSKAILNMLILGGMAIVAVAIGTAAGSFSYPDAVLGGRLSSTFQYPNTLAAYVSALYFITLSLIISEERRVIKGLYGIALATFLFTLILTYSRAMWLIFPIVAIGYFIIQPNKRKLESLLYMIMSALLSLPGSFLFTKYMDGQSKLWIITLAVALGTGILIFLVSLLDKEYRKVPPVALTMGIIIIILGLTSAGTNYRSSKLGENTSLVYEYIPERIVSRFTSISSGENSFTARMRFNMDGLKIVKEYPVFGAGGGGWVTLYQEYQSAPYWTSESHNFFMQLWIEIGSLGFGLFLAMLAILIYEGFKSYRKRESEAEKTLIVGLLASIMAMLGHAFLDFDMSLFAYALIFWTILGVYVSIIDFKSMDKYFAKLYKLRFPAYGILAMVGILMINSLMIIKAKKYLENRSIGKEDSQVETTIKDLEKAVKMDIYQPSYRYDLVQAYLSYGDNTGDMKYLEKAKVQRDKYTALTAFNGPSQARASSLNMSMGEIDKALELLERATRLQALISDSYAYKLDGYMAAFQYYYNSGNSEKALEMVEGALSVKEQIKENNEKAEKPMAKNNELVNKIGQIEGIYKNYNRLEELARDGLRIDFAYYFDLDINYDGEIDMLETSKPEGSKISHEALTEGEDSFIRMTNPGEKYGFKYIAPINLEPGTTYVVELKARGNTKTDTFNLYTWSNGAEKTNQGELKAIELREDWQTFSYEFTTDLDIEPGKQYIRMQHNGNDHAYVDVKDLVIFTR